MFGSASALFDCSGYAPGRFELLREHRSSDGRYEVRRGIAEQLAS